MCPGLSSVCVPVSLPCVCRSHSRVCAGLAPVFLQAPVETVRFQMRHSEGALTPPVISLCADEIWQADGVLGSECRPDFASSPCVKSTNTVSVSEHLWNFKTVLHNSVICKSCQEAQATLIQTHAKWQKFSDKELMPTGISSARERGHPHPPQRTHAIWHKFCSDPCNQSLIQSGAELAAEGRRR